MKAKMQKFNLEKKKVVKTRKKDFRKIQEKRKKKRHTDDAEIEALTARLWPTFDQPKEEITASSIKAFTDLPISKKTLEGLKTHNFTSPTDIQRESLMYGLKGHDILGAAKTGSGKTLAFLIPILETLFKQRYTPSFGMAALVISPTRELAYQSYDVLMKIGKLHDLSFGLVTGGMNLKDEARKMNTTNVVICTPGRLLQHFEQTPNFTADELKILVLDEADKILQMGFAQTMNAVIEALPRQRQTLLFSATQTKSVKDLARLSLKRPIYVSVHEKAKAVTPTTLGQRYIVCEMQDKINILWSFIRSHRHAKILVFLSCCKQTRYIYQVFKKMHPGLTILCLHGHMKQHQRMEVYHSFSRKQNAVLLATDVAARGLDFPVINWVVQVDKPENVNTYIHRVGRTARYEKVGEALLMLLPTEEKKMVEDLVKRKIPIEKLKVSKKRMFDITKKLESLCASDKELKDNAQKAFVFVMKTLWVLDKPSFQAVDQGAFAASLGLVQVVKLPFLEKSKKKTEDQTVTDTSEEEDSDSETDIKPAVLNKGEKTLNFDVLSDDEEDDDIYNVVKDVKVDDTKDSEMLDVIEESTSKRKKSRAKEKLKLLKYTTRITFDEEGNPEKKDDDDDDGGLNISQAQLRMREQDKIDKEQQRQRIKLQHREKRLKEKENRRQAELQKQGRTVEDAEVVLGAPDDDDDDINNEEAGSDNADKDSSDDENDEPRAKRQRVSSESNEISDESDGDSSEEEEDKESDFIDDEAVESDNSESDEENGDIETELIERDEEAVLALLGGKS
uniref:ATP-dependent RNA helicase n=1 Tax=Arion vulgaris TaxID=1028688 RepID=A0A0B7A8E2_9EUPU